MGPPADGQQAKKQNKAKGAPAAGAGKGPGAPKAAKGVAAKGAQGKSAEGAPAAGAGKDPRAPKAAKRVAAKGAKGKSAEVGGKPCDAGGSKGKTDASARGAERRAEAEVPVEAPAAKILKNGRRSQVPGRFRS